MYPIFRNQRAAIKPLLSLDNGCRALFLGTAIAGFAVPILFTGRLDKLTKFTWLGVGEAGLICNAVLDATAKRRKQIDDTLKAVQEHEFKGSLKHETRKQEALTQMACENEILAQILSYPPYQREYWANRLGVSELLPRLQQSPKETVPGLPPQVQTEFIEFTPPPPPNLAKVVADDLRNTLTVGVPGAGKGLFISNALAYVQARGDTTVFYLDPKNDEKETGYFAGRVDCCYRLPKGVVDSTPEEIKKWLEDCLSEYERFKVTADKPRKLIVVDELTALMEALEELGGKDLKWFKRKINTYVASGDSRGITFWGIAQNGHNTGVGMDGGEKSQLTPIALVSVKQLSASQGLQKADFIPADKKLSSDEIKQICAQSEIGRAIFHGGLNQWFPMPVLPNPSGYDRDKRTFVKEPTFSSVDNQEVELELSEEPLKELQLWALSLSREPTPAELEDKFKSLTGYDLLAEGVEELLAEVRQWRKGISEK